MKETALPKFDSPPVVETAISVQFETLPNYTNAHSGWFWKKYLGPEWTIARDAPRIENIVEGFGDERKWRMPGGFAVSQGLTPDRTQIIRSEANNDRMIQVQNSRVIYNWRRQSGVEYPSYSILKNEFADSLKKYEAFCNEAALGALKYDVWELVYVNHIPKGGLWKSVKDWPSIFPFLTMPPVADINGQTEDSLKGEWQYVIGKNVGRLYITMTHARVMTPQAGPELIELKMIARGPINKEQGLDMYQGLDEGHRSIVQSFAKMTSESAHRYWKRTS